jgi:hypothetical protein
MSVLSNIVAATTLGLLLDVATLKPVDFELYAAH